MSGDIPFEGDFMDDLPDVIIGAVVTTKTETPEVASEREEIPEEIGTERDAPENVVDNLNDDMADEVMELRISPADDNLEMTKILKTITSRLRKLLKKLSMKMKVVWTKSPLNACRFQRLTFQMFPVRMMKSLKRLTQGMKLSKWQFRGYFSQDKWSEDVISEEGAARMKSPMKIIQVYYTEEGKIPEETFPNQI